MTADRESILESLGTARRYADPGAPVPARLLAAAGTLPLPPDQIAAVLFALCSDPEPEIRTRAQSSLDELPEQILEPALSGDVHPELLGYWAESFQADEVRLEKIALNPSTSDETYCFLASLPFSSIIDITSRNQIRLLRCPDLFETLGENLATSQATIDRILEFLGLGEEEKPGEEPPELDDDEAEAITESRIVMEDLSELPPELMEERGDEEEETEENPAKNLLALIQNMRVIEKVKLARFGTKEARTLLLRDRNRIVATAAIRSPKVTENEVISVAQSRNVSDDVLRVVANTREWTKNYRVKHSLACNPRAPLPAAIKFLNYLTDRDLKAIMRSRDVPNPVAAQARRILARKGKV